MKTLTTNASQANLANLITSKAIVSKRDGRFGTVLAFDTDSFVIVNLERMGQRKFKTDTVLDGFELLQTDEQIVEATIARSYDRGMVATDKDVYDVSIQLNDLLEKRFHISTETIYKTLRNYFN